MFMLSGFAHVASAAAAVVASMASPLIARFHFVALIGDGATAPRAKLAFLQMVQGRSLWF
jgi:hypothetical protein